MSKPSDLIPECRGRFPICLQLQSLGKEEFVRILTEPHNALIRQYTALLGTEDVRLTFGDDAVDEIADIAATVNEKTENIGARRLHTVLPRLLDDVSLTAPEMQGVKIAVNREFVRKAPLGDREGRGPQPVYTVKTVTV